MKSKFEIYRETVIPNGYIPERAIGHRVGVLQWNKVPLYLSKGGIQDNRGSNNHFIVKNVVGYFNCRGLVTTDNCINEF